MDDTYDQREAVMAAHNTRSPNATERVLQAAIRRAEHGHQVLLVVKDRATVMDLNCYVPMYLSRYLTIRCINSHNDIDWELWRAPGWENHELFVVPDVLSKHFPHVARMFSY